MVIYILELQLKIRKTEKFVFSKRYEVESFSTKQVILFNQCNTGRQNL